jgi:hypothetical protein
MERVFEPFGGNRYDCAFRNHGAHAPGSLLGVVQHGARAGSVNEQSEIGIRAVGKNFPRDAQPLRQSCPFQFSCRGNKKNKLPINSRDGARYCLSNLLVLSGDIAQGAMDFHMTEPCSGIGGERACGTYLIGNEPLDFARTVRQPAPPKPPKVEKPGMGPDRHTLRFRRRKSLGHDFRIAGMKAAGDIDACNNVEHGGIIPHAVSAIPFPAIAIEIDARHDCGPLLWLWSKTGSGLKLFAPKTLRIKQSR